MKDEYWKFLICMVILLVSLHIAILTYTTKEIIEVLSLMTDILTEVRLL